jgi:hypothetical protein
MVPSVATEKKSPVTPPGIDPETVRIVAQCLNHYATPGLINGQVLIKIPTAFVPVLEDTTNKGFTYLFIYLSVVC